MENEKQGNKRRGFNTFYKFIIMETILILHIINGLAYTVIRMREIEILRRWKEGTLPYEVLLACKKHKFIHVRKLNPHVKMGRHPGFWKKDD